MNARGAPIVIPAKSKHFYGHVHQLTGATALTAGQVGAADIGQIMGDADFLLQARSAIWTPIATGGRLKVQFEVVPGEVLFQAPMWLGSIGTGQFPQFLSNPRLITRGSLYKLIADDRQQVAAAASLRVLSIGARVFPHPYEPPRAYVRAEPFRYLADYTAQGIGNIAANATIPTPVNIGADADFMIHSLIILADGDATVDIISGGGKNLGWFSRACHIALLGATDPNATLPAGGRPFRLPSPVFMPAVGSLQVTVADLSGAANNVQVIFEGVKLKPAGGLAVDPGILPGGGEA